MPPLRASSVNCQVAASSEYRPVYSPGEIAKYRTPLESADVQGLVPARTSPLPAIKRKTPQQSSHIGWSRVEKTLLNERIFINAPFLIYRNSHCNRIAGHTRAPIPGRSAPELREPGHAVR